MCESEEINLHRILEEINNHQQRCLFCKKTGDPFSDSCLWCGKLYSELEVGEKVYKMIFLGLSVDEILKLVKETK